MNKFIVLLLCANTFCAVSMNRSKVPGNNPPLASSQLYDQEFDDLIKKIEQERAQRMPRQLKMLPPAQIYSSQSDENLKEDRDKIVICGIRLCNFWRLFNSRIQ